MRTKALIALFVIAASSALVPARADHDWFDDRVCTDQTDDVHALPMPDEMTGAGYIALPAEPASYIVVMSHGYGHTVESWVEHLKRTAAHGAIAFALDGKATHHDDEGNVRGWDVSSGADLATRVAQSIASVCEVEQAMILGVSMGGNTSGLAVAMKKTMHPSGGRPLFKYWVAVEPAANVIETYLEATAVAPANGTAARAKEDIEAEMGGTLWEVPEEYTERTVVLRAADIAASGVEGVAVVHGFDDGLVPYNQGRELAAVLRLNGVPTDFYNAARRETDGTPNGSDNTTLTENVARPILNGAGQEYTEPLAGHGTESSQTHIVIQTGLDILFALLDGNSIPADHEFIVDGEAGTIPVL